MRAIRLRAVGGTLLTYGVLVPVVLAGVAFAVSTRLPQPFGTVLFGVFVVAAALTALGARNNPDSNWELRPATGFGHDTEDRWTDWVLVKLVLVDLGLAAILTVHAEVGVGVV